MIDYAFISRVVSSPAFAGAARLGLSPRTQAELGIRVCDGMITNLLGLRVVNWPEDSLLRSREPSAKYAFSGYDEHGL